MVTIRLGEALQKELQNQFSSFEEVTNQLQHEKEQFDNYFVDMIETISHDYFNLNQNFSFHKQKNQQNNGWHYNSAVLIVNNRLV